MRILFVGDVMLGRLVNEVLKTKPPKHPWGNMISLFKQVDLKICNLECVMTDVGVPWSTTPKVFHFRTDEKNIKVLTTAGINIVSLANNHVLDYEDEGLLRMREILAQNSIHYVGAGSNFLEAQKPAICEVKRKKVGLIAFTDNEPQWEARENKAGVFYLPVDLKDKRAKDLLRLIRKTKNIVDLLIISTHWGPNWGYIPPPEHIPFAQALIEAGADIVFGHSGHVFRGIEIYKGKPILYCAGDFIDDYAVDEIERNDESFVFVIEEDKARISRVLLYPTIIENFQAKLATDFRQREIVVKMQKLCQDFQTKTTWDNKQQCLKISI